MKLDRRVVAVGAVVALTLGTPAVAFAGPKSGAGKKPTSTSQKAVAKKAEARNKAERARAKFTVPGTVTAVSTGTVTISRKVRGVVVAHVLEVPASALVKRDDARTTLDSVVVGDHAVAKGTKVDGRLVVGRLVVESAEPSVESTPATPTVEIVL